MYCGFSYISSLTDEGLILLVVTKTDFQSVSCGRIQKKNDQLCIINIMY